MICFTVTVVCGKITGTKLMGVDYVAVEAMVQLVMKSTHTHVTPGKLTIAVPLDPDWMCNCPGVNDLQVGKSYLITGKVNSEKHVVCHQDLVTHCDDKILEDMEKHKKKYHRLKFMPSLSIYRNYFT